MPLFAGHLAVGYVTTCTIEKPKTKPFTHIVLLFLLANSPDIDIAISWLLTGNPYTYHRTFTHSILFAVLISILFANLPTFIRSAPKLSYKWCYWAVISHSVADYLFSPWEVAFLWPVHDQPGALNGILDHVSMYANLAREVEVILICAVFYCMIRALAAAACYLHRYMQPT